MDDRTTAFRAEAARRMKAARWLLGSYGEKETRTGRKTVEPTALSAASLASRAPMRRDGITANFVGRIERMEAEVMPMHLRSIAEALGLGDDWFDPAIDLLTTQRVADLLSDADRGLDELEPPIADDPRDTGRRSR